MSVKYPKPICTMCAHWEPGIKDPAGVQRCVAFPDGIPDEIWEGLHDHRGPLGKERPLFKLADGYSPEDVEEWEQWVVSTGADRALQGLPDDGEEEE